MVFVRHSCEMRGQAVSPEGSGMPRRPSRIRLEAGLSATALALLDLPLPLDVWDVRTAVGEARGHEEVVRQAVQVGHRRQRGR
jgi:hypothetical protein